MFELNVGAPHASEATPGVIAQETDPDSLRTLVGRVRAVTAGMQLWVKLSGLSSNLPALALAASQGGADAVVMMGRFMAVVPDLDTLAPVLGTSGAYGGRWALPIVCRFLALTRRAVGPAFPLLGTNGARSGGDVARLALAGASAAELLSVVMHEGFGALSRIIDELDALLVERGLVFTDLIGRAADGLGSYADQPERPGRWKDFVPADARLYTNPRWFRLSPGEFPKPADPDSMSYGVDACKHAWHFLIDDPDRIRSIGAREWACVTL